MDGISLEHLTQMPKSPGLYERFFSSNLRAIITKHRLDLEAGSKPFYSQTMRAGPEKKKIIED